MQYVNVKGYADEILERVTEAQKRGELWIFTMGDDPASASYVNGKLKDCDKCGIVCKHVKVRNVDELMWFINECNNAYTVGGIIVQLPLPEDVDANSITQLIAPEKDVDGFTDNSPFDPCTPAGIMHILHNELSDLTSKRALVIGRGDLVGIPMLAWLLNQNCTVTVAHSKTTNLDELLACNDIIIAAAGKPNLVDLQKCKAEIVIDVGVNRDENGKLCGDCYNFVDTGDGMKVTPVPGGIGLMTRAMLMSHMV